MGREFVEWRVEYPDGTSPGSEWKKASDEQNRGWQLRGKWELPKSA